MLVTAYGRHTMVMIPAQNKVKNFSRVKHTTKAKQKNEDCAKSVQKLVFSGPYFPVFGLNTKIYSVNLCIQSAYRKIRTRKNSVFGRFSRSEIITIIIIFIISNHYYQCHFLMKNVVNVYNHKNTCEKLI